MDCGQYLNSFGLHDTTACCVWLNLRVISVWVVCPREFVYSNFVHVCKEQYILSYPLEICSACSGSVSKSFFETCPQDLLHFLVTRSRCSSSDLSHKSCPLFWIFTLLPFYINLSQSVEFSRHTSFSIPFEGFHGVIRFFAATINPNTIFITKVTKRFLKNSLIVCTFHFNHGQQTENANF